MIYYVTFFEEEKANNDANIVEKTGCSEEYVFAYNSFIFKIAAAFIAGGIISDYTWIKMGTA